MVSEVASKRPIILVGGLTGRHERLIQAAFEAIGYASECLGDATLEGFHLGRHHCSAGQCNPVYFTVGNLIHYLKRLEASGLSRQQIIERYAFLTAAACGPCRFGMYEAEYQLALKQSGFEGFRLIMFQQHGGANQPDAATGLQMDADFFLRVVHGLIMADLLNQLEMDITPYECEPGTTASLLDAATETLYRDMLSRPRQGEQGAGWARVLWRALWPAERQPLRQIQQQLAALRVDWTRPCPRVKITGEFWAQTAEGEGNYGLKRFLLDEGVQVRLEPLCGWLNYLLHQQKQKIRDRRGLAALETGWLGRSLQAVLGRLHAARVLGKLSLAEWFLAFQYQRFNQYLGGSGEPLLCQYRLQRLAHPHYNSRSCGGEGHLEVGHLLHFAEQRLAHLLISVKPFGCMPSTQSDGIQAALVRQRQGMGFQAIETSGDGKVNALSRVQMALTQAHDAARAEVAAATAQLQGKPGLQARMDADPRWRSALLRVPRATGVVAQAAHVIRHLAANGSPR